MPRRHRFSSERLTHALTGVGIAFTSFLLVLGIFLGSVAIVKIIRSFIESRIDAVVRSVQRAADNSPLIKGVPEGGGISEAPSSSVISHESSVDELIFASFSDLFSSMGGIDGSKTTMYRDDAATAFLFPPKLVWSERPVAGDESLAISHKSCVGNVCLAVKGTVLTKDGAVVALPVESNVESVTADAIGDRWLVGIVRKEGGVYAGYAYRYAVGPEYARGNGTFTPLFPDGGRAFESEYKGSWGFGGAEDDFLAVYGAYQGKGYRIRSNSPFPKGSTAEPGGISSITDISWLFDVRIMRGGIMPGIVRAGEGVHAAWYLFNKERSNRSVFIKLFQNGTEDIQGEADLLGTAPFSFSYFILGQSKEVGLPKIEQFPRILVGYGEKDGVASTWDIRDEGFNAPQGPVTVTSLNLNNYHA